MYEPETGDEITFVNAEVNRDTVYTVTEINDAEITVTTPKGYMYRDAVFTYGLTVDQFRSLGPRKLEATRTVVPR